MSVPAKREVTPASKNSSVSIVFEAVARPEHTDTFRRAFSRH